MSSSNEDSRKTAAVGAGATAERLDIPTAGGTIRVTRAVVSISAIAQLAAKTRKPPGATGGAVRVGAASRMAATAPRGALRRGPPMGPLETAAKAPTPAKPIGPISTAAVLIRSKLK